MAIGKYTIEELLGFTRLTMHTGECVSCDDLIAEIRRRLERGEKAMELLGKIINSRTHGIQTTPGYGNSVEGQYLEEARSLLAEEAPDATS